jgi:hypothetical protein
MMGLGDFFFLPLPRRRENGEEGGGSGELCVEWVYEGERFEGRGGSAGVLVDVLLAVPVRR